MPHLKFISSSLLFVTLVINASRSDGQVELERLFPPVASAGTMTAIKGEGKFPKWPVTVICDRDDVTIKCGEKAGEFEVAVTAESRQGVAWVRMHDERSATSLTPLLIERSSIVPEVEPNETVGKAKAISLPAVGVGKLERNSDIDMWRIQLSRGQLFVVQVTANRLLASPMDAVLQLVDLRGNVLAQSDDDRGLDPQLIYQAPSDSELCLRVFAFPETPNSTIGFAGGANFVYTLQCTASGFIDHVLPLHDIPVDKLKPQAFGWNIPSDSEFHTSTATAISPVCLTINDAFGHQFQRNLASDNVSNIYDEQLVTSSEPLSLPLRVYGHIATSGEIDRVQVAVKAGTSYRAQVASREFGFPLDSVLRVVKADGSELARNDDGERGQYDAVVDFKVDQDGPLTIELSDLANAGSLRHAYALSIATVTPSVELSMEVDHLAIENGKTVELPIKVQRLGGYASKLEISAVELPAGVSAEKVISEAKGDSAKGVKLKLVATAEATAFQGPIQIIATSVDDQSVVPVRYSLRRQFDISQLWLTVAPK